MNDNILEKIKALSRNEIYSKLLSWFGEGKFITSENISPAELERKSNNRELSYTGIPKIIFVGNSKDNEDFLTFRTLVETGRILSPLGMKVKKDLRTLYGLHKAVKNNEIMRFDYKKAIIYID